MDLRRGIQAAVEAVVQFLQKNKRDITTSAEIAQVATISANGDVHIGQMIANAMEKVGKEGVITCKEGKTVADELEVTEGMRFDRGFVSPTSSPTPSPRRSSLRTLSSSSPRRRSLLSKTSSPLLRSPPSSADLWSSLLRTLRVRLLLSAS
ncbi:hypothetical protein SNK04_012466 [Fusarium graminearum]